MALLVIPHGTEEGKAREREAVAELFPSLFVLGEDVLIILGYRDESPAFPTRAIEETEVQTLRPSALHPQYISSSHLPGTSHGVQNLPVRKPFFIPVICQQFHAHPDTQTPIFTMPERSGTFTVEYTGRVAIVTICNESKLNALNQDQYFELSQILREVATHDEVFITMLTAKGRFFSVGADVSISRAKPEGTDMYREWLGSFVANNLNATQAFYTHPKVLVVALNGPVIGLSAALVAFADFIYCAPHAFLLTPFSSLGLVAEGGASRALVQRLGPSKANEALIMSRRIPSAELLQTGFVNRVFDVPAGDDARFRELVLAEIDDKLGAHLIGESLTGIKALIRRPERDVLDRQNVDEVFAGLQRFLSGVPQAEFAKIASGQKRHKL